MKQPDFWLEESKSFDVDQIVEKLTEKISALQLPKLKRKES